jgi:hypothetical protein
VLRPAFIAIALVERFQNPSSNGLRCVEGVGTVSGYVR